MNLNDYSENLSFHRANKAYYKDKNYEEAIKEFKAAIEFERSSIGDTNDSVEDVEYSVEASERSDAPNEIITKSMYWMAESYCKLNQINQALESFEQLALRFSQHHLGRAAERQLAKIEKEINPLEHEKKARQRAEKKHREKERELERKRQEAAHQREVRRKHEQERANKVRLEKERRLKRERETQVAREKEKQTLLVSLREYFEKDFLKADRFYRDRCTSHISFKEYETEKINAQKVRQEKEKLALLKNLREYLGKDFLNTYRFYQDKCTSHISSEEYKTEKINFVQSWGEKNNLNPKPDQQQAAAIGAVEDNIQVVARAGSGKTATLVNRARFLQQHCGVSPDEMLLLAFNKKAAEEIRERLAFNLQDTIPYVMTFHALAYALVHPEELIFDEPEGVQRQSRAIQDGVIDHFLADRMYYDEIRTLMLRHFRTDWERIDSGGYNLSPEEMLCYRRSLLRETLDGKHVKSSGEKMIANFLFEHNIKYRYERNFWWSGVNYRPDFTIFTGYNRGVIIEYFGLKGNPEYDAMSEEKRNYWRDKPDWKLLEFFPHDLKYNGEEGFLASLKQQLEDCGIRCDRLIEEEIWNRINIRAINRFTTVIRRFIQRCRQLSLTPEQLLERVNSHDCDDFEGRFLNLARVFYESYLQRLQATGEEDYDGLMQQATKRVAAGETEFKRTPGDGDLKRIRYVLIDEYQDFSDLFYRLVGAIREQNPKARFFCVGDDWQAINGFAGSDLRFFQDFAQNFPDSRKLHVTTNYRSGKSIVNTGNALMKDLGKPARAYKTTTGSVVIANLATFEPTLREEQDNPGDSLTPAVLRLVNRAIANDNNIVLIARKKTNLPWYVNYKDQENAYADSRLQRFLGLIRDRLPEAHKEKVTASTVHSYKGLERDVVIVLDAVQRCFPLIHPNLIFTRIFGDNIESVIAEERRLFYVALTRAVESLYILTETNNLSPFLEDIEKDLELARLNWSDYPPVMGARKYFTIRIGNQYGRGTNPTFRINDLLRAGGFDWKQRFKAWCIVCPAEEFSTREFISQSTWSDSADGIEVQFCDDFENLVAVCQVNGGEWTCISGKVPEPPDISSTK